MPVIVSVPAATTSVPNAHPTLAEAIALVRQDIFDQSSNVPAGTSQRFLDTDLARALDRAVDEYSFFAPYFQQSEIATAAQVRTYPVPTGTWWVDEVEYPTGAYPAQFVDYYEVKTPTIGAPPYGYVSAGANLGLPTLADGGVVSGGPGTGAYRYKMTYVTPGGESIASAEVGPYTNIAGHGIQITNLCTGPVGAVGARNLYRTVVGGASGTEKFLVQIADNTTTTYLDALPDSALGTATPPTVDTTAGVAAFTMKISTPLLPSDATGIITVTSASKHILASNGTTIPEWHRDAVILGAAAYAILAYQVPTNDLFEYQDGEMRDRVDQKGVAAAWLHAGQEKLTRFRARLELIKREANSARAAVVHWGDKPARWDRV